MAALPKVIVAGGGAAFVELQTAFPPTSYNLFYADSLIEAAEMAPGAAVLVVDAGLPGGGVELCRQLRSQPDTAGIPLVLRIAGAARPQGVSIDAVVAPGDFDGLIQALQRQLNQTGAPPPLPRRAAPHPPSPATEDSAQWDLWPPELAPGEELMEYSHDLSGFLNALLERLASPGALSGKTAQALKRSVNQTMERVSQLLLQIQSAINEALMSKDLTRTKVLSSTKNSLYDKLQRLRALASKIQDVPLEPVGEPTAQPQRRPEPPQPGPLLALSSSGPKSALTRAAEARQTTARPAAATAPRPPLSRAPAPYSRAPAPYSRGSARRSGLAGLLPGWMWMAAGAGVLIISAVVTLTAISRRPPAVDVQQTSENSPPVVKLLLLEQTRSGVLARPVAEDKERDRISFRLRWFINGELIEGASTARLSPDRYSVGDTVLAEVTPVDNYSSGKPHSSAPLKIVSLNRPPPPLKNVTSAKEEP